MVIRKAPYRNDHVVALLPRRPLRRQERRPGQRGDPVRVPALTTRKRRASFSVFQRLGRPGRRKVTPSDGGHAVQITIGCQPADVRLGIKKIWRALIHQVLGKPDGDRAPGIEAQ